MSEFFVPFGGRSHVYTEDEIELVVEIMQGTESLTQGTHQKHLEEKFAQYIGVSHTFAVSNATSALELAAQLCKIQSGDEVVVPAHTFTSSAYPFAKMGANLIWADIDFQSRVMSSEHLKKCITGKTRVVIVPHLYGYGADMPNIMDIAKDRGILVIEDVAQAIGVDIEGKKAGSYGDISVYSFHAQKNMTSLGEGGMIGFTDDRYAEILPMIRHNGHCDFTSPREEYWLPAMGNVDLPELDGDWIWPNNYCLSEIPCALASKLLDRIEFINNEKRARAIKFIDRFSDYPEIVFHRENSSRHNYHLLAACLLNGQRDEFIRKMSCVYGIQCAVQYYPLNRYPFYERLGFGVANCPNTDKFFDNMISFPFYHSLNDEQIEELISAGLSILDESRNT